MQAKLRTYWNIIHLFLQKLQFLHLDNPRAFSGLPTTSGGMPGKAPQHLVIMDRQRSLRTWPLKDVSERQAGDDLFKFKKSRGFTENLVKMIEHVVVVSCFTFDLHFVLVCLKLDETVVLYGTAL